MAQQLVDEVDLALEVGAVGRRQAGPVGRVALVDLDLEATQHRSGLVRRHGDAEQLFGAGRSQADLRPRRAGAERLVAGDTAATRQLLEQV